MIQSTIVTKAPPEAVWAIWKKAHNMDESFVPGKKGKAKALSYRILEVSEGSYFTILWKSLFVKLLFSHRVAPAKGGAEICYSVEIRGPFAWPMRLLLRSKIERNLAFVLKSLGKELEMSVKTTTDSRRSPK
jgi:hypothetical protein